MQTYRAKYIFKTTSHLTGEEQTLSGEFDVTARSITYAEAKARNMIFSDPLYKKDRNAKLMQLVVLNKLCAY